MARREFNLVKDIKARSRAETGGPHGKAGVHVDKRERRELRMGTADWLMETKEEMEMPECSHRNVIVGSFQVGNVNAPVVLRHDGDGRISDFDFVDPADRATGEISDPVFYCEDCGAKLEIGSGPEEGK